MLHAFTSARQKGFTLIEVVVALAILAWVLASSIFLVSQYADERTRMRDNFLSNQVAWNQLMHEYRYAQGWGQTTGYGPELSGSEVQGTREWFWKTEIEPAVGQDLYHYQLLVAPVNEETELEPYLSLYLVNAGTRP